MTKETLVRFIRLHYGKVLTDINVIKLIKNKKPPIQIEIPVMEFAGKNCLFELGGYNKTSNKGVSMMIFDEDFNLYDGLRFFKGNNRKVNGKQAIVPIRINSHVVFGSIFQRQNKLDIRYNVWIYRIIEFKNRKELIDEIEHEYKTCICELIHFNSSSVFSIGDMTDNEYKEVISLSLKKTGTKDCKKAFTNAWFDGKFNADELNLIDDIENIVNLVPKTFRQIINVKNSIEDYFIENDKSSIRTCLIVFRLNKDVTKDITMFFHIFKDFDIKSLKQQKKRIFPKIHSSFRVNIPEDYVFGIELSKFFLCPERTASSLYKYIENGEKNSLNYINNIPFSIRLFKG